MLPRAFAVLLLCSAFVRAAAAPAHAPASGPRPATPDEIALLTEALEKTARDMRRWAYTESQLFKDDKGKVKTDTVVRYDPSKPYPEQYTPITINGKPPTASDLEKYRKRGERAQKVAENPASDRRKSLGEVLDLPGARVVSTTGSAAVFEVPLKKEGNDRFPPEKFEVLIRVDRVARALENIAVRLKGAFRSKLVLKVKSGEGTLDFASADPKHPPALTAIKGDASASILFFNVGGELALKRTELKHVKPYDERFEVQIGNLRAIDF
jgi:hypothetical protein